MSEKDIAPSPKSATIITEEEYIQKRLNDQMDWFSAAASKNQKRYKHMRSLVIVLSVLLPFLVGLVTEELWWLKLVVGLIGVAIAAIEGLLALNKYEEKWQSYRATAEALKREKYTYLTKTDPYSETDSFKALVGNIEALLAKESDDWKKYINEEKEDSVS